MSPSLLLNRRRHLARMKPVLTENKFVFETLSVLRLVEPSQLGIMINQSKFSDTTSIITY